MKDDAIKQLLKEHLKSPKKESFNHQIMQQLNVRPKKQQQLLFNEKFMLQWFLFIAGFVLFFYLQQASKVDANAILIGSVVSVIPIYLLIFNKINSLKK